MEVKRRGESVKANFRTFFTLKWTERNESIEQFLSLEISLLCSRLFVRSWCVYLVTVPPGTGTYIYIVKIFGCNISVFVGKIW